MMEQLKEQWAALPSRTRQFASVGGVVVGLALAYTIIWSPLQRDLTRLRTDVPRETGQLGWMRTQTPVIKAMRAKMSSTTGPVLPAVEQSATSNGVRSFATKLEADGSNGARVTLDQIPFNMLLTWISELQASQGLSIEEANIEAQTAPGVVNAKLRLRAGGA